MQDPYADKKITCACAFVFDNQKLLMIKNKRGWDIPGGTREIDEHPDDTVEREILEEGYVTIKNLKRLRIQEFPKLNWHIAYYSAEVDKILPFKGEYEISERSFIAVSDFKDFYTGGDGEIEHEILMQALKK